MGKSIEWLSHIHAEYTHLFLHKAAPKLDLIYNHSYKNGSFLLYHLYYYFQSCSLQLSVVHKNTNSNKAFILRLNLKFIYSLLGLFVTTYIFNYFLHQQHLANPINYYYYYLLQLIHYFLRCLRLLFTIYLKSKKNNNFII